MSLQNKVWEVFNKTPYVEHKSGEKDGALLAGSIGVEIELENCGNTITGFENIDKYWSIHTDGSLRNNGMEFVFSKPLSGKYAEIAIRKLHDLLRKFPVEKAVRTSVHVHIDVGHLTLEQLMKLIIFYLIAERQLFRIYAPNRYGNHFCLPLKECETAFSVLDELFHKTYRGRIEQHIGRYCALNIAALNRFGSLEFRHHPGEYESDKIIEWCNAALSFKHAALDPLNTIDRIFSSASELGPIGFMEKLFPEATFKKLDLGTLMEDFYEGVRVAQSLAYPSEIVEIPEAVKKRFAPPPVLLEKYLGTPGPYGDYTWNRHYDESNGLMTYRCVLEWHGSSRRHPKHIVWASERAMQRAAKYDYITNGWEKFIWDDEEWDRQNPPVAKKKVPPKYVIEPTINLVDGFWARPIPNLPDETPNVLNCVDGIDVPRNPFRGQLIRVSDGVAVGSLIGYEYTERGWSRRQDLDIRQNDNVIRNNEGVV